MALYGHKVASVCGYMVIQPRTALQSADYMLALFAKWQWHSFSSFSRSPARLGAVLSPAIDAFRLPSLALSPGPLTAFHRNVRFFGQTVLFTCILSFWQSNLDFNIRSFRLLLSQNGPSTVVKR